MALYERFHCKLWLKRKIQWGNREQWQKSQYQVFYSKLPTPYLSIGSAPQSIFYAPSLMPTQAMFNFQNDSLVWIPYHQMSTCIEGISQVQQSKECRVAGFQTKKLVDTENLLTWNVQVSSDIEFLGRIDQEREVLSNPARQFLEGLYGPIHKIHEGFPCQIYQTNDNLVLKILPSSQSEFGQRFLQRGEMWPKMDQMPLPFLAKIINIVESPVTHICMEYFPGEPLGNWLAKYGHLREASLNIVKSLLQGLNDLAEKNFEYPCIFPNDVLYEPKLGIKLHSLHIGFTMQDIKIHIENNPEEAIYLCPEYWGKEIPAVISPNSAIYSLGVLLYHLVTGKPLFQDFAQYQRFLAQERFFDRYTLMRTSLYISPQLAEALENMLALSPQERPNIAEAIAMLDEIQDLSGWKAGEPTDASTEEILLGLPVRSKTPDTAEPSKSLVPSQENQPAKPPEIPTEQPITQENTEIQSPDQNIQQFRIKSQKLAEFYEQLDATMPSQKATLRKQNLQTQHTASILARHKIMRGLTGLAVGIGLFLSLTGVLIYKSLTPKPLALPPPVKIMPITAIDTVQKEEISPNKTAQPSAVEQGSDWALEGQFSAQDQLEIRGYNPGNTLHLTIFGVKGQVLVEEKLASGPQKYSKIITIADYQKYIEITACTNTGERKSVRIEYPLQYWQAQNCRVAYHYFFNLLDSLEKIVHTYLTNPNSKELWQALQAWHGNISKDMIEVSPDVILNEENFGPSLASLQKMLKAIRVLGYKLHSFLLYRLPLCPHKMKTFGQVLQASQSKREVQQLFSEQQKLWPHSPFFWTFLDPQFFEK